MPQKLIIDDRLAVRLANAYANTPATEKAICEDYKVSKYYFRKALDRVIILGIIDDNTAKKIAKKADENHRRKLRELNLGSSDKIKIFYDSLLSRRAEYDELGQKYLQLENYFSLLDNLECNLELAKFQEDSFENFVSSDDEKEFRKQNSEMLAERINSLKLTYSENIEEYNKVKARISEIEKSVS